MSPEADEEYRRLVFGAPGWEPGNAEDRAEYNEMKARHPEATVSFEEWYAWREHERNRTVQGFSSLPDISAATHKKILNTPPTDAAMMMDPAWRAVTGGRPATRRLRTTGRER